MTAANNNPKNETRNAKRRAARAAKKAANVAAPAVPVDDMGFPKTFVEANEPATAPEAIVEATPIVAPEVPAEPIVVAPVEITNIDEALAPKPPTVLAEKPEDFPAHLEATMLIYDIPSNVKYPNPSDKLRRVGFRENKSCWVIPAGYIPHTLINDLRTKAKANVELIRFDPTEGPRLCRLAVDRMKRELADQVARAKKSIEEAEKNHLALTDEERANNELADAALLSYNNQCKWVLERVEKMCKDVDRAIRNFGVNPNLLDLATTRDVMNVLQTGYKEQASEYVKATAALRAINTPDAQALAKAAEADNVPPAIMADMLRDNGNDDAADALQNAFAPPAAATDDDTFDLVDKE